MLIKHVRILPVCFAVVISMTLALPATADTLLAKSKKVTTFTTTDFRHFVRPYAWLSNDKVVLARYTGQRDDWDASLVLRTNSTGKEKPLARLTNLFDNGGVGLTSYVAVTSDGKWLMWFNESEDSAVGGIYGGELDGAKSFKHANVNYLAAMPILGTDSIAAFLGNDEMEFNRFSIYQVANGRLVTLRLPEPLNAYDQSAFVRDHGMLFLYCIVPGKAQADPETLVKMRVADRLTEVSRTPVFDPADAQALYLAPDGKHIAWATQRGQLPETFQIVITDIDGKHARSLGRIDDVKDDETARWRYTLSWLPDGRHISYVYHNALYVVPAF